MALSLFNSLTRKKEPFEPLDPERVRMYVCGPTVYDYAHIGNARPVIVFDVLFRLLRHIYGDAHVIYVRNITDVDDKINARAAEEGVSIRELTERTARQFHEDIAALNVLPPTVEPRATDHIAEMQAMIQSLLDKGHAYEAEGHVLFSVASDPHYGCLSHRSVEEMLAGARVEVAPYKRDPMDFVLWKPSQGHEPGWDSPWGYGRPGWHIECSAMSEKYLGETFDIHGGGQDLIFPHHENEIAQSTCAHGNALMARYWVHNGYLQVEGEKMSKSLGNFITIHELLATDRFGGRAWPGEVLRLAMLMTHYRQPLNWTEKTLREAKTVLDNWYALTADVPPGLLCADMLTALEDDLNTPRAIAALHELRREAAAGSQGAARSLKASAQFLGLLAQTAEAWKGKPKDLPISEAEIEARIAARSQARANKDWAEADRIRDELAALGIQLKDGPEGTSWEYTGS